jgi:hypothetical protein
MRLSRLAIATAVTVATIAPCSLGIRAELARPRPTLEHPVQTKSGDEANSALADAQQ